MIAYRIIVSGRVQGVSFRQFCEKNARELGVRGWVRNESNGNVMLEVEGKKESVGIFLNCLRKGPESSIVKNILAEKIPLKNFHSFKIIF